eukprot:3943062-Amphidinium_carterae.1
MLVLIHQLLLERSEEYQSASPSTLRVAPRYETQTITSSKHIKKNSMNKKTELRTWERINKPQQLHMFIEEFSVESLGLLLRLKGVETRLNTRFIVEPLTFLPIDCMLRRCTAKPQKRRASKQIMPACTMK